MTVWRLLWRGWRFYARVHIAVALCVLLATAVLAGALLLGDSADRTLQTRALERLGQVEFAMDTGPRQVRAELADDFLRALQLPCEHKPYSPVTPVLWAEGIAKTPDDRALANEVRVLGVKPVFWELSNRDFTNPWLWETADFVCWYHDPPLADDEVVLGQPLAEQLGVKPGDTIVLVFPKPSPLPVENPLSDPRDNQASMLLTVRIVLEQPGRFALRPSATPPLNAFVSLETMQRVLELPGRANLLLLGDVGNADIAAACYADILPTPRTVSASLLRRAWALDDAQLELREFDDGQLELRSPRVLLDESVVRAAKAASPEWSYEVTTWFVNEIRVAGVPPASGENRLTSSSDWVNGTHNAGETPATRACPYSTVAAVERPAGLTPLLRVQWAEGKTPPIVTYFAPLDSPLADDEIVINDWLADDLGVAVGDEVQLTYYQADPGRKLVEASRTFRLVGVTEMTGVAADRELMPEFPGLSRAESCRGWQSDWVDMSRVRPKDEAYWTAHRGTPKAFVSPAAAREMWGSARGSVTAVRFGAGEAVAVERAVLAALDPADLGMTIVPVRERMLASARQATDLGELFLGLGGGVILAALLMLWLVLSLAASSRAGQAELMRSVGFSPRRVRGLLLAEFSLPVVAGVGAGVAAGVVFAWAMLSALGSTWSGAVAGASLELHVTPTSLVIAGVVSLVLSGASVWAAIRPRKTLRDGLPLCAVECCGSQNVSQSTTPYSAKRQAIAKHSTNAHVPLRVSASPRLRIVCAVVLAVAAIVVAVINSSPVAWFLAGAVVLVVGLAVVRGLLRPHQPASGDFRTLRQLAWRNASRRVGRSFAVVALLGCAAFLILAVGAYRQRPGENAGRRDGPTGGFALIGQSSTPILGPLVPSPSVAPDSPMSPASPASPLEDVAVVPMRVRDGEDASCLNLNRPSQPRLLGVEPGELSRRGAFVFSKTLGPAGAGWGVLDLPLGDAGAGETPSPRVVPGVADESTIRWSLHKKLGDEIEYTDEFGRPLRVRLAGQLAGSVLQGSVLISRADFDEHFPSAGGFRFFLLDAPPGRQTDVAAALTERHSERGLSLVPTTVRLAQLQAVENSYLTIFQVLSALGLVLGSAGLGLVVTRNIQDRRGELATLAAVGFSRGRLMTLVLLEHTLLLSLGLSVGVAAAVTALVPRIIAHQDWASGHVALLLVAVVLVGFTSAAGAVWAGFRRALITDLRSE